MTLTEDGHFSPSGLPCMTVAGFFDLSSSLDWGKNGGVRGEGLGGDVMTAVALLLAGLHPFFSFS